MVLMTNEQLTQKVEALEAELEKVNQRLLLVIAAVEKTGVNVDVFKMEGFWN
jgi:DNA polymerase I-like protein with 3'-5' exonuclease and polymerase domains